MSSDDESERENPHELPDPREEPVKAAETMLRQTRDEMSGDLYDDHEEVRKWAMNLEWACAALAEHEDSDYDSNTETTQTVHIVIGHTRWWEDGFEILGVFNDPELAESVADWPTDAKVNYLASAMDRKQLLELVGELADLPDDEIGKQSIHKSGLVQLAVILEEKDD